MVSVCFNDAFVCVVWCFWVLDVFGEFGFVELIVILVYWLLLIGWFLVGFVWCCVVWVVCLGLVLVDDCVVSVYVVLIGYFFVGY